MAFADANTITVSHTRVLRDHADSPQAPFLKVLGAT
jgi:hypothetical protein